MGFKSNFSPQVDDVSIENVGGILRVKDQSISLDKVFKRSRSNPAAVGEVSSVSNTTITGTSFSNISGLSVTLSTTGNPVMVTLIPQYLNASANSSVNPLTISNQSNGATGLYRFLRGGTVVAVLVNGLTAQQANNSIKAQAAPPGSFTIYDFPAAGTHTYTMQARLDFSVNQQINFNRVQMLAWEVF